MADLERLRLMGPREVRGALGDGNYGGLYERPEADLEAVWTEAVAGDPRGHRGAVGRARCLIIAPGPSAPDRSHDWRDSA